MRLSLIDVDPQTFQKRETPYSPATVDAIVAEGIVLTKFDALPLLARGGGSYVVGGDGHSRYEALTRLAADGRLPEAWRVPTAQGDDWDVPHKLVDADEARDLAWTGNLRGTSFTPCEEARVFQEMLDANIPIDKVATKCHVTAGYVRKSLPLNGLCRDIRLMVGHTPDAGGVDKYIAQAMAERFARHKIGPQQQQELWHKVLKHADLTVPFVRSFLDTVGAKLAEKTSAGTDGFLFEIPTSVASVMGAMKDRAQHLRQASRGLAWLMQCKDGGILATHFPALKDLLDREGAERLEALKAAADNDGKIVGVLCNQTAQSRPAPRPELATLMDEAAAAA